MLDQVLQHIDRQRETAVEGLKQLLAIESISAQPDHTDDCRRCAGFLGKNLEQLGLSVQIHETGGHPIITARNQHQKDRPTVLLYGHYDVQPAQPLEQWTTPPFQPVIRNDANGFPSIFARGASDDKGPIWAHVQAIAAWQKQAGQLPVNLIVLFEGEEEIGSKNLENFIHSHRQWLQADVALISDTAQFARNLPAIVYGLRGLVYLEVFLTGASHDLHSGLFGGAVPNPANVLCQMLASLHDENGRVTVAGFYDDVVELSAQERALWGRLPVDEARFFQEIGLAAGYGEAGFTSVEQRWARPTLDINGLTAGYQGAGAKTVIASVASAKFSCRLVPNQDPEKIERSVKQHLMNLCPPMMKIEFASHGASPGILVPHDSQAVKLASQAIEIGFGHQAVLMREGGSIPVVGLIQQELGIDTLLVGFGLPDDRIHSPNEKLDLGSFYNGIRTAAALYERLSHLNKRK
ncbi:MAG: dipeptidase [Phycisphaerales bacterium]|nr:dipeptidase [Phycisphaerales bacterium]